MTCKRRTSNLFVICLLMAGLLTISDCLSLDEVSRAITLDSIIVDELKRYLIQASDLQQNRTNAKFQYINRYIEEHHDIFSHVQQSSERAEKTAADAVASLMLVRRLAVDWPRILRMNLNNTDSTHATESDSRWIGIKSSVIEAEKNLSLLVEEQDVLMHSDSFARLIEMYKLKLGEQQSTSSSLNLQVKDAMLIGSAALTDKYYGTAADVFYTAQQFAENSTNESDHPSTFRKRSLLVQQLKHLVHLATSLHDRRLSMEGYTQQNGMFSSPFSKVSLKAQKEEEEPIPSISAFKKIRRLTSMTEKEDVILFGHICRGKTFLSEAEKSKLTCRFDTRGSSYYILMPALVEQHSLDPELVTFHRVVTKRQIQEITSLGIPFLQQAAFRSGNIKEDSVGSFKIRSSYTAWLQEDTHPVLKNLNKKISALTGLHLNDNKGYSEALQLNVYGAGGYYSPHVDAFNLGDEAYNNTDDVKDPGEIAERREGDRIATVMFYMNDVEAGGYTAFPRIGVGVKPTEGSAVFWTNLLSDGSTDVRTLHGACPVLKGIKWVSNKWVRYLPQFRPMPCGLMKPNIM